MPSLLPTGKSLTAFEVVRQCWREEEEEEEGGGAEGAAAGAGGEAPPALIGINCMAMEDPKEVGLEGLGSRV